MHPQPLVPLAPKTTMHIGGRARYFAELKTRKDVEEAYAFVKEKNLPLIPLGAGSNTIFADGIIEALVVRIAAQSLTMLQNGEASSRNNEITNQRNNVLVEAGLSLATLVAKLAERGLDLSPLTGIPGTVGGAVFGNAGQGPQGIWMDSFVENVTVFTEGKWQTLPKEQCVFSYRESIFKHLPPTPYPLPPIIWEVSLSVPSRPKVEIQANIETLLKKRLAAQPFAHTAGSCFKALPDGTPAWKVIEAAGLKGRGAGDLAVSEKHANFLINKKNGTFADAEQLIAEIRKRTEAPLELEMRCIGEDGSVLP